MKVTIRKSGTLIDISTDGKSALPQEIRKILEPKLRYKQVKPLFGFNRIDPITGEKRNANIFNKELYKYDENGRMICGRGLLKRIYNLLKVNNYQINIVDKNPSYFTIFNKNQTNHPYWFDKKWVTNKLNFFARQEECLDKILENDCGVIHAVTGFGKMVMILMTCLAFGNAKIDIVTRRKDLVNKLVSFLTRYVPNVGQVGAGSKKYGRITVYTAKSLCYSNFDANILLCDEAHELITDDTSRYLAKYRFSRNFAFTASPSGRLDGSDMRMQSIFGPTIFYISYPEAVSLGLVVPICVEWSDVQLDYNPCTNLTDIPKKRHGIWRNSERNAVIANKARTFANDEQVLITVDFIEHAVYLRQHLPEFTLVYDNMKKQDREFYIKHKLLHEDEPLMTPALREKLREDFESGKLKKAISTVWDVGIDPRELTALIRAEASSSEIMDIQAPGRVSRTHKLSGKEVGIVCDFRDQFDVGFAKRAKERFKHYQNMGWDQVNTSHNLVRSKQT